MQTVYAIADLHLGHEAILEYEPKRSHFKTIEEHDAFIIDSINSVVNPTDTLYILGDVAFGRYPILKLGDIKCRNLKLILGNHDDKNQDLLFPYFSKVSAYQKYEKCILSHVPVHPSQLASRFKGNIHGHLHSDVISDPRYACVSVEPLDFKPTPLLALAEKLNGLETSI